MFLAALALLLAQADAAPPPAEVIVRGQRNQKERIGEFVRSLTPAPPQGQLARFEFAVCPAAFGLPASQARAVVERMHQVAAAASVPLGRSGCDPNLLVIVTADKQAFLQNLRRSRPDYFPLQWSGGRIAATIRDPSPAVAWHFLGQLDQDGRDIPKDMGSGLQVQRTTRTPSRLSPSARPQLLGGVLVVQAAALEGLTTTQLADYAAMRLFVPTDPAKLKPSAETILAAVDAPMGSAVPLTLTAWDLAFLKGYYASSSAGFAPSQRSDIRRRVEQDLQRQREVEGD